MPIYEYECLKCGGRFDVIQKMSDEPIKKCKYCKKTGVRKLLGTPALQFKGTGWYITDYAGKSPAPNGSGPADGGTASKTEGGSNPDKSNAGGTKETPASTCACSGGNCPK